MAYIDCTRSGPDRRVCASLSQFRKGFSNVGDARGYRDHKLDFVVPEDESWKSSVPSWDVWAPANGYAEMKRTVQRYGCGYNFRRNLPQPRHKYAVDVCCTCFGAHNPLRGRAKQLQLVLRDEADPEKGAGWKPRIGVEYA